ncbi:MAG TPA: molybdopterin biosynthesis protein, partial [Methanomicrobiales archaeon]|nr:molybdopterin biosynthesis protein [Methanomicrobiales archaeon]
MKRYLKVVSLDEALRTLNTSFTAEPRVERIPVEECRGRITASPVFTRFSVPPIHLSAMDGIAVKSEETVGASEQHPVTLPDAVRVNTGNIVPHGYDAVVMIEDVWVENGKFRVRKPVSPWQHVRPVGEDIGESEMILPSG